MFIALMVFYLIVLFIEFMPIYKGNRKKELRVFMLFSSAALILNLLLMIEIKVTSPAIMIKNAVFTIMGK
jgi:hypothetical protein